MKLPPAAVKASSTAWDCAASAVQPNTLPPRHSGNTSRPVRPRGATPQQISPSSVAGDLRRRAAARGRADSERRIALTQGCGRRGIELASQVREPPDLAGGEPLVELVEVSVRGHGDQVLGARDRPDLRDPRRL